MSALRVWKVKKAPNKDELIIICPHCKERAIVGRQWADPRMTASAQGGEHMTVGRPCTYCFATSQLPENAPGGKPRTTESQR